MQPQLVVNHLVLCTVIKSRTQDECYVVSVPGTPYIALLPRDKAQRQYAVGDSLFAVVEEIQGWRNMLTQKGSQYVKLILQGIFALKGTVTVIDTATVRNANFYKVLIKHSELTESKEVIFDALKQCNGFLEHHITERITFIPHSDDIEELIVRSLMPGQKEHVKRVILWKEEKKATVFVESAHKSLFFGAKGVNVATAAKLTGWEIEIV